jgi:hypothetical protein
MALLIPFGKIEDFSGLTCHGFDLLEVDRATAESERAGLEVLPFWASTGSQSCESSVVFAGSGFCRSGGLTAC